MNFDPEFSNFNDEPESANLNCQPLDSLHLEDAIVSTIVSGSGGPNNHDMTESGLRFVRHLLTISKPARHGFLPNFGNMKAIRQIARDFIARSGSARIAVSRMLKIASCD